jgi:hypothetical protein
MSAAGKDQPVEYAEKVELDEKDADAVEHKGIPRPEDLDQNLALETGEADEELKKRERSLLWKIDLRLVLRLDHPPARVLHLNGSKPFHHFQIATSSFHHVSFCIPGSRKSLSILNAYLHLNLTNFRSI